MPNQLRVGRVELLINCKSLNYDDDFRPLIGDNVLSPLYEQEHLKSEITGEFIEAIVTQIIDEEWVVCIDKNGIWKERIETLVFIREETLWSSIVRRFSSIF